MGNNNSSHQVPQTLNVLIWLSRKYDINQLQLPAANINVEEIYKSVKKENKKEVIVKGTEQEPPGVPRRCQKDATGMETPIATIEVPGMATTQSVEICKNITKRKKNNG